MKAPDKIYVASYNGESFSRNWTMEPLGDITATEYIRKEALLKYLNNYKTVLNNDEELYRLEKAAAVSAIEEVVNHINEM